uniref:Uncharacterized protein n=1 Tax=Falco tinnunculus TaxID=100819 RepID=A0A8C4UL90_FALTI
MRILYLLFPFVLLLAQGAAGSPLGINNEKECQRQNGYCGFLKCHYPFVTSGRCSRFYFCCKNVWG